MREHIRSYQMFLPFYHIGTRILFYLGYPLFFIWMNLSLCALGGNFNIIYFLLPSEIISIELLADYVIFGGIASRETNRLEYLRSSQKGIRILRHAFRFDVIRRFTTILVIFSAYTFGGYVSGNIAEGINLYYMVCVVLSSYLTLTLGIMFSRYFTQFLINTVLIGNLLLMITIFIQLFLFYAQRRILILFTLLIVNLVVVVVGNKLLIRRAKEGYYDR